MFMAYKLIITKRADELLDNLIFHLLYNFKSEQATIHLINSISKIYDRIQENPFQFPKCKDKLLSSKEYREAIVKYNTKIIYSE